MYVPTSLVVQTVKCLSTMRETWVLSLGWEDSMEKEMATHFSTSCLENPMDGGAWCRLLSMASQKSQARLSDFTFTLSQKETLNQLAVTPSLSCPVATTHLLSVL